VRLAATAVHQFAGALPRGVMRAALGRAYAEGMAVP